MAQSQCPFEIIAAMRLVMGSDALRRARDSSRPAWIRPSRARRLKMRWESRSESVWAAVVTVLVELLILVNIV